MYRKKITSLYDKPSHVQYETLETPQFSGENRRRILTQVRDDTPQILQLPRLQFDKQKGPLSSGKKIKFQAQQLLPTNIEKLPQIIQRQPRNKQNSQIDLRNEFLNYRHSNLTLDIKNT